MDNLQKPQTNGRKLPAGLSPMMNSEALDKYWEISQIYDEMRGGNTRLEKRVDEDDNEDEDEFGASTHTTPSGRVSREERKMSKPLHSRGFEEKGSNHGTHLGVRRSNINVKEDTSVDENRPAAAAFEATVVEASIVEAIIVDDNTTLGRKIDSQTAINDISQFGRKSNSPIESDIPLSIKSDDENEPTPDMTISLKSDDEGETISATDTDRDFNNSTQLSEGSSQILIDSSQISDEVFRPPNEVGLVVRPPSDETFENVPLDGKQDSSLGLATNETYDLDSISVASYRTGSLDLHGDAEGDDLPPKPKWHPPWQLKQEIIAHDDAIPVLVIDPTNRWFATGSTDNTIRMWDIENYRVKLMIKAHKQSVRSMTFGMRHRYLFSTGDDRQLLCHDVEVNRVLSKYKGQSTVIYGMCMYPPSRLLVTGARDKLIKLYDTRTTKCVKQLGGHQNTVSCVLSIPNTQKIVSGSHDGTLRIWDIGEGKCIGALHGHMKSIRAICQHPGQPTILSASSERILAWDIVTKEVIQEIPAKDIAINSIAINHLGVTVAGGSNGVMHLWDFTSGFRFQKICRNKVYESQEIPICVFATKFDLSGTKLICSGACNVVKIYQEAYKRFRPYLDPGLLGSISSLGNKSSCSSKKW